MKLDYTLPIRPEISKFSSLLLYKKLRKCISAVFLTLSLVCCLIGCSKSTEVTSLQVEVWYQGKALNCDSFERSQKLWSIQQLAFFVSNMHFSGNEIEQTPQLLKNPWQSQQVTLIQPALFQCDAVATNQELPRKQQKAETNLLKSNNKVLFVAPLKLDEFQQLSFTLGVPFELNHLNPLTQHSPLNLPTMFWSWRAGHKFFRLDLQGQNDNWAFHLGSVGCSAASTMRAPQKACIKPNRVDFTLDKKADGKNLVMHVDRLLEKLTLENASSCLFHSDQESCPVMMQNLQNLEVFEWH